MKSQTRLKTKSLSLALVVGLTASIASVSSVAAETTKTAAQSTQLVKVNVKGMVCDFCARGLEKVFYKQPAVSNINVNLKNSLVKIQLKPNQTLADDKITKLITDNGISVVNIER